MWSQVFNYLNITNFIEGICKKYSKVVSIILILLLMNTYAVFAYHEHTEDTHNTCCEVECSICEECKAVFNRLVVLAVVVFTVLFLMTEVSEKFDTVRYFSQLTLVDLRVKLTN